MVGAIRAVYLVLDLRRRDHEIAGMTAQPLTGSGPDLGRVLARQHTRTKFLANRRDDMGLGLWQPSASVKRVTVAQRWPPRRISAQDGQAQAL